MVAAVNYRPTSLHAIESTNLKITPQSGWDKFVDILAEIFTLGFAQTRFVNDELPDDVKRALATEAERLAADPSILDEYRRLRRDSGYGASTIIFDQLRARIRAESPDVPDAQIRAAAAIVQNALEFQLSEAAPVPMQSEGFNALTAELERTLQQPRAVATAQGGTFRAMADLMQSATRVDRSTETARDALGVAGLFTLGLTWGAAVRMDRDAAAGVITPPDVEMLRQRVASLPASDRAIFGVMMQTMANRENGYLVFRGNGSREAFDALSAELLAARPNDATTRAGQILANIAALDLALSDARDNGSSLAAATSEEQEVLRNRIADQLSLLLRGNGADVAPAPASVQRVAIEALRDRLQGLRETAPVASVGLGRLLALAPAAAR